MGATSANSKTQITKKSLVKDTVDRLRSEIIIGMFPVGERLTETRLSELCNVSRGTIRSAIQELANENLVEYLDNGGCIVTGLDDKSIRDITDFRMMLEIKAAGLILNSDNIVYSPLIESIDKYITRENSPIYKANPFLYYVDLDLEIHKNFIFIANNKPIYNAWLSIMPIIRELLVLRISEDKDYGPKIVDTFQPSHKKLLDYAITKDKRLLDYIEYHITGTTEQAVATIQLLREKQNNPQAK